MTTGTVHIVDDDAAVREGLSALLESAGIGARCYASADDFLSAYQPEPVECLVLDLRMPEKSGLVLQAELEKRGVTIPTLFLSAYGDIPTTVRAIKGGAMDFLTKPANPDQFLAGVKAAFEQSAEQNQSLSDTQRLRLRFTRLSAREREVMELAITGVSNKEIARRLGISYRTVELHRAHMLRKMGATNMLELAQLAAAIRQ